MSVSPYFSLKRATFFSHRYKVMTLFSCRLLTTPQIPSSDILSSSVLCKFSHIFLHSGSPPGWCHPGRSASPSDDTDTADVRKRDHGRCRNQEDGSVGNWTKFFGA